MRSQPIEAFGGVMLNAVAAEVDITITELADMLRQEHGASFARSTIWRYLDRQGLKLKTRPHQRTGSTRRRRPQAGLVRRAA